MLIPFCLSATTGDWPYGIIHFFGDSHCGHLFTNCKTFEEFRIVADENNPQTHYEKSNYTYQLDEREIQVPFAVHWMGPRTMHRIGRDGIDISSYGAKPGDIAVFCIGEIDVRVHIGRQVYLAGRDLEEVIEALAKKYIQSIRCAQLNNKCRCAVISVISPGANIYQLSALTDKAEVPSVSLEERILFTRKLNEKLLHYCQKHNIQFLNPFEFFTNPDGSLDSSKSPDSCHIYLQHNHVVKDQLIHLLLGLSSSPLKTLDGL